MKDEEIEKKAKKKVEEEEFLNHVAELVKMHDKMPDYLPKPNGLIRKKCPKCGSKLHKEKVNFWSIVSVIVVKYFKCPELDCGYEYAYRDYENSIP